MVFSSVIFLFFFLPLVLAGYHLLFLPVSLEREGAAFWRRASNLFLLLVSLLFYFWGEAWLVWIVIASTLIDYGCGLLIAKAHGKGTIEILPENTKRTGLQRFGLILSLVSNLSFLAFFKYFNFGVDTVNAMIPEAYRFEDMIKVTLPLGISFYTFQSMSYTIDVYRGHVKATRNLVDFACFVTLFPQLVAGPIVRYCDVAKQMVQRRVTAEGFASGVTRFTLGLGKKVLVANTVAQSADKILALSANNMTTPLAWLCILCYSLQIYYDFSGYSDMAIGLGRMFGFEFLENFNYPYVARSIQDFWRRWHISLSTWFRDYLYIPLGGSRASAGRTYFNLVTVFFLCGLWHGASWAFVVWGLFHGAFLVIERVGLGRLLKRLPIVLQHAHTLLAVMVGWVLFASSSFENALIMLKSMIGFAPSEAPFYAAEYLTRDIQIAIVYGMLFSMPLLPTLRKRFDNMKGAKLLTLQTIKTLGLLLLLFACAISLSAETHNPFIYFRF